MSKLVRVDDHLYERLHRLAGRIQAKEGRPVSISEAIHSLLAKGEMKEAKENHPEEYLGHLIPGVRFTREESAKEAVEKMEERLEMGLKKGERAFNKPLKGITKQSKKAGKAAGHMLKEFSFTKKKFI